MEKRAIHYYCDCFTATNEEGIKELEYSYRGSYGKNIYMEYFSSDDAETVNRPIFFKFNDEFDLLIDFHEEEEIPCDKLPRAKEILCDFLKGNITDMQRSVAQKILSVVEKGIEVGSPVELEL